MGLKKREDYMFVAYPIDLDHSQNLGDYAIAHKGNHRRYGQHYHYDSRNGRLTNRTCLRRIENGSYIYRSCVKAVERLKAEVGGE